jgi:SAM-dependent methyltransferase
MLSKHHSTRASVLIEVIRGDLHMYLIRRSSQFLRGFIMSYGPSRIKKRMWENEYSGPKWNFADHTVGDCVYAVLEKYASCGAILDLGCGSGNTATELNTSAYQKYIGVDISENALMKAAKRSRGSGRQDKNSFVCSDFLGYTPTELFDVILFRESMYHIPLGKIKEVLDHYSPYLKDTGVFIVRLFAADRASNIDKARPLAMLRTLESAFHVVEKNQYDDAGHPTVVVFKPNKSWTN